jgi:hypothetical protein
VSRMHGWGPGSGLHDGPASSARGAVVVLGTSAQVMPAVVFVHPWKLGLFVSSRGIGKLTCVP